MSMRDHFAERTSRSVNRGCDAYLGPLNPIHFRASSVNPSFMKTSAARLGRNVFLLLLSLSLGVMVGQVRAQGVEHLRTIQPGGMPGRPVVTGIERATNGMKVMWDGPAGYYQLFQKPALDGSNWQALGKATNLVRHATITSLTSNAFFRVAGPTPRYAGAVACADCHENVHTSEMNTRHAGALETLRKKGEDKNPSCLPCHTVGYGLPTGFNEKDPATAHLGGVQCENCHGPAANHADNENDITVRPRVEIAATVCGGCHNEHSHRPHFEQWSGSAHASVTEDMNPPNRINSCGRCHSGSSRMALLNGKDPSVAAKNDANVAITCVVCHDPHQTNGFPAQLRNPVASTNDYFLSTSESFTNKYNPNINVCAQCHNHRGASWTSSSRPPHHSPQYNILLGTVGELDPGEPRYMAAHATQIEEQCVGCHMQKQGSEGEVQFIQFSHTFQVKTYESCLECHPYPEGTVELIGEVVHDSIQSLKTNLDRWATTSAPAEIQKYGTLAWEYYYAGALSNPEGAETVHGPVSNSDPAKDEQKYVPANIKKARFNLYLVLHDGSYGVHNVMHSLNLLDAAQRWVQAETKPTTR